ncbi:MAG: O-antigen ligase family protein [Acutalibacteraceae bacterium]
MEAIKQPPVTGAGLGTAVTQDYIRDFNLYHGDAPFVHAHNFYLQVWIEAGLLGIVGFVGSMLWNIKRAAHTVRHCGDSTADNVDLCGGICFVRSHGVRTGRLSLELSSGNVYLLVCLCSCTIGDQDLPRKDGLTLDCSLVK